eukprot:TRINITY_DN5139_c0_g1_i1.p1 TRINITY_DN5139_c0_g1~~TRINITY_DN5139_c0_g1_i1.p1  ORF type:complete len:510 (-),score=170.08 TRINITY_DN5139_c0_g1_i1:1235-2545(-)
MALRRELDAMRQAQAVLREQAAACAARGESERAALQERMREAKTDREDLARRLEDSDRTLRRLEQEAAAGRRELAARDATAAQLRQQAVTAAQEAAARCAQLEEKVVGAECAAAVHEQREREFEAELRDCKDAAAAAEATVVAMRHDLEARDASVAALRRQHEVETRELRAKLESSVADARGAALERDQHQQRVESLRQHEVQLTDENHRLFNDSAVLSSQLREVRATAAAAEADRSEREKQHEARLTEAAVERDSVQAQLAKEIEHLDEAHRAEVARLRAQHSTAEKARKDAEDRLTGIRHELAALRAKVEDERQRRVEQDAEAAAAKELSAEPPPHKSTKKVKRDDNTDKADKSDCGTDKQPDANDVASAAGKRKSTPPQRFTFTEPQQRVFKRRRKAPAPAATVAVARGKKSAPIGDLFDDIYKLASKGAVGV